jgi:hypothetical protein
MRQKHIEQWTGLVMMGDGFAGLIWPREYLRKLKIGPQPLNDLLEACAQRPVLTRALCVVEVAFGAWIFKKN